MKEVTFMDAIGVSLLMHLSVKKRFIVFLYLIVFVLFTIIVPYIINCIV
jgi:hypothetical protein